MAAVYYQCQARRNSPWLYIVIASCPSKSWSSLIQYYCEFRTLFVAYSNNVGCYSPIYISVCLHSIDIWAKTFRDSALVILCVDTLCETYVILSNGPISTPNSTTTLQVLVNTVQNSQWRLPLQLKRWKIAWSYIQQSAYRKPSSNGTITDMPCHSLPTKLILISCLRRVMYRYVCWVRYYVLSCQL